MVILHKKLVLKLLIKYTIKFISLCMMINLKYIKFINVNQLNSSIKQVLDD
jgi:hypothetical protein